MIMMTDEDGDGDVTDVGDDGDGSDEGGGDDDGGDDVGDEWMYGWTG